MAQKGLAEMTSAHEIQVLFPQDNIIPNPVEDFHGIRRQPARDHIEEIGFGQELQVVLAGLFHELMEVERGKHLRELIMVERLQGPVG